jgi:hypothetical protein
MELSLFYGQYGSGIDKELCSIISKITLLLP